MCRPMIDFSDDTVSETLQFWTDASKNPNLGFGCVFENNWTYGRWNAQHILDTNASIEYLELFALCAGVLTWEKKIANRRVTIFCDNQAVVQMVNNNTSSCRNCMILLRILTLNNLKYNQRIFVKYIRTNLNKLADSLSRLKFGLFWKYASPGMSLFPSDLPKRVWPMQKLWLPENGKFCPELIC